MKKVIFIIITIFSFVVTNSEELQESRTNKHIEDGFTLSIIVADDYEARSGKESSDSTMRQGFGFDIGYQLNVLTHLRINPYLQYRYVQFTSMIEELESDRADVFGIASTIELDWSPKSAENLMASFWYLFPLYIIKLGGGINIIRFTETDENMIPALSYTIGIGFPYKRFSIHIGGEGNLFFYNSNYSELDAYKLKIGYWF